MKEKNVKGFPDAQDGTPGSDKKDDALKGKQIGRASKAELYSHQDKTESIEQKRTP